jgi:pimeloyl-ACP methyl ester carboxylesterase
MIRISKCELNILTLNPDATKSVVMIHGIFTNLSLFYFNIAQKLSQNYRVILYDLRGHGLSAAPHDGYDLQTMSGDLLNILHGQNIRNAHLVGYSYGGLIALHTAMQHPNVVDKLVIIETPDLGDGQVRPLLKSYNRRNLEKYLKGLSLSTKLSASKRKTEKIHEQVRYLFEQTTFKEDLRHDLDLFARIAAASIKQETLLLYAQQTPCGHAADFLNQNIEKSTLAYGDGDHNIPVQNPTWIAEKILGFLAS